MYILTEDMTTHHIPAKHFIPQESTLRDDALHRKKRYHIETFYYDAVFENHYSIVCLVNIIRLGWYGLVLTGMFIYKDTTLVNSTRRKILYHHLAGSEHYPHIAVHNQDIIRLDQQDDTSPRKYAISMGDNHDGFSLRFLQKTPAWHGRTALGNWLVIPWFNVDGDLYHGGSRIPVQGHGYHDHNIYPLTSPFHMQGYHFGKITTDEASITWANVMKKQGAEDHIIVVTTERNYLSLPQETIDYTIEEQVNDHGKNIPKIFRLSSKTDDITLNVRMELTNVHYIHMPMLNYWRCHLRNTGELQIKGHSFKIQSTEISELLKFF
jgi:hypothetical protein